MQVNTNTLSKYKKYMLFVLLGIVALIWILLWGQKIGNLSSQSLSYGTDKEFSDMNEAELDAYMSEAQAALNIITNSPLQVSCQSYRNELSDGIDYGFYLVDGNKHDLSKRNITVGQTDPNKMKYFINYGQTSYSMTTEFLVENATIGCPTIDFPVEDDGEGLVSCDQMLSEMDSTEREWITCTGSYSFTIERDI